VISQKTPFFIVTAVKTSNFTQEIIIRIIEKRALKEMYGPMSGRLIEIGEKLHNGELHKFVKPNYND
jgi:hypothetical protein